MPLNGAGTWTPPPGTTATPNTTILSAAYNALVADLTTVLNTPRPIAYGGTNGTSVITGWDGLAAKGTDIATAGTINLTTATGPSLTLTGTTTVTAVTLAEGSIRLVRANAAFQITASASLLCNGSAVTNLTVAAEDLLVFRGGAGGVVSVARIGAASVSSATTSAQGIVELATVAEALAGTDAVRAVTPAGLYFPTGHISPTLTIDKNGSDASNDIDISAFTARDSTDTSNIVCAARTKQIDAGWAVGTNAGGLDTGAVSNTTYYLWGIRRSDTAVCDVLYSLSNTAPTMPTNYDSKVLLGELTRVGGVNGIPTIYGLPKVRFSGAAPIGACRAWVNFNGTGTVAIRASLNVSSITDNGTGDYTVNYTTAMADANYSIVITGQRAAAGASGLVCGPTAGAGYAPVAASCRFVTANDAGTAEDPTAAFVAVFR